MKAIKIYEDEAGNKLYKRFIKTRNVWQYSAKNREGRLVKYSEYKKLRKESGI
jgi:hypothetical protein